jgi:hypothetical protein
MRAAVLSLLDSGTDYDALTLPRRFVTPRSEPAGAELDPPSVDGVATGVGEPMGDSLRPTAALPARSGRARQRSRALAAGLLGLVLAVAGLAFVTTGGQPSPPARASGRSEPAPAPRAPVQPNLPAEVLVELVGLPPEARVRVDGREVSGAPIQLARDTGAHQISVDAPGMQLWSVMHDARTGGRYAVSLAPEPAPAKPRGLPRKSKSGLLARPDF